MICSCILCSIPLVRRCSWLVLLHLLLLLLLLRLLVLLLLLLVLLSPVFPSPAASTMQACLCFCICSYSCLLSAFVLQILPLLLQAEAAAAGRVRDESDCNHLSAGAHF